MTFPIGNADKKKAFDAIADYFAENNLPFCMYLVEEEMFKLIEEWYPGKYQIKYNRDDADYLYEWDTLAYLKGKKLHGISVCTDDYNIECFTGVYGSRASIYYL